MFDKIEFVLLIFYVGSMCLFDGVLVWDVIIVYVVSESYVCVDNLLCGFEGLYVVYLVEYGV